MFLVYADPFRQRRYGDVVRLALAAGRSGSRRQRSGACSLGEGTYGTREGHGIARVVSNGDATRGRPVEEMSTPRTPVRPMPSKPVDDCWNRDAESTLRQQRNNKCKVTCCDAPRLLTPLAQCPHVAEPSMVTSANVARYHSMFERLEFSDDGH